MRDDAIAAGDYDSNDLGHVVKTLTPGQATRRGWSFIAGGALLLAALFWWQGCLPGPNFLDLGWGG